MKINTFPDKMISIWEKKSSIDDFFSDLPELGEITPYNFYSIVLFSSTFSIKELNKKISLYYDCKIEEEKENSALYYLYTYVGKNKKEKIDGRIIFFQKSPRIYILFTIAKRNFLDKCIMRFISNSYPVLIQPVFKQKQLSEILTETEKNFLPHTIRIVKTSSRRWIISPETTEVKKQLGSRLDWENMSISIRDAFKEASEEDKWFLSLTFKVYRREDNNIRDTGWKSTITKRGIFMTNKWFEQYSKNIIPYIYSIAEEKMKLFKNRSRKDVDSYSIRPLILEFEGDVFDKKETNQKFISILKKIPHFGYSVIHSNPYIHMSLLDYKDGSSFEILVHKSNSIVILPQICASSVSLEKIVGHITEEFEEVTVRDF